MKPTVYRMALLLLCLLPQSAWPQAASPRETPSCYVIPIEGMIERGLVYVIRRSFAQAERNGAGTIIFDMNTPGGRLDATEEIIHMLRVLPKSIKTVTYVNPDALSAGSMLALATDEIYMAPGSRIGASAVVTLTGDIPEGDMKKKIVSATLATVRSAAQSKGHRPELAEAMMRADYEYKIGDEVICPAGQLLTLSDQDAMRMVGLSSNAAPLLATAVADNMDALLQALALTQADVVTIQVTLAEKIARWIEMLSILFLAGGLLGLYIEFKTPGFGIPGVTGILLLGIWFWGYHIAGLAGTGEMMLFAVGAILLLIEIFVIPGFGVVGITGITCMMAALLMAMLPHIPGIPWYRPSSVDMGGAVITLGVSLLLALLLMLLVARYLPRTNAFNRIALAATLGSKQGYSASHETGRMTGRLGVAVTALHPAGIGEFDGKRLDVVARGSFIEAGRPIVIAETHGNRIVVDSVT